jgi:hydrogenase nickel incorporation protein HypA/HybF
MAEPGDCLLHELAIVLEVIDLVTERAQGGQVRRVVLEIGKLTAVLPDAIRFSFDVCSVDTVVERAELVIVETPALARCRACGSQLHLQEFPEACGCGSFDLEWLAGTELNVREVELA